MGNTITAERFAAAYENGRGKTINFLKSRGFTEQMAEEAAQAAWARGWERKAQLRDPRKSIPWVNSIALNLGRTLCRRAARLQELTEVPVPAGSDVLAAVDVRQKLRECPPRERELLEKRYLEERELSELAREEGCTNQAMRIRLYRARQILRRFFEESPNGQRQAA
jgi:RNA polymerase sigma-70 factor, ECF subfamily